jgi:hypothetical protein
MKKQCLFNDCIGILHDHEWCSMTLYVRQFSKRYNMCLSKMEIGEEDVDETYICCVVPFCEQTG